MRHLFLVCLKFILHLLGLSYVINTLLTILNIDIPIINHIFHIGLIPWVFLLIASYTFLFCYVHRLPLWYILINEILILLDYYFIFPISIILIINIHLILIGIFIIGYSYYYYERLKEIL